MLNYNIDKPWNYLSQDYDILNIIDKFPNLPWN